MNKNRLISSKPWWQNVLCLTTSHSSSNHTHTRTRAHAHPKVLIQSKWSKDTDGPWQSHTHSPPVLSTTRSAWNQNPAPGLWPAYLDEKHFLRLCNLWPWGETHLTHTYTCKSTSSINNEINLFLCLTILISILCVCVYVCLGGVFATDTPCKWPEAGLLQRPDLQNSLEEVCSSWKCVCVCVCCKEEI